MTLPSDRPFPRKKAIVEDPEQLGVEILGFLAADPDRLQRFLDLTGFDPAALRRAAAEHGFATMLLDHLAADDRLFLAFAEETRRDPAGLEATRQRLAHSHEPD